MISRIRGKLIKKDEAKIYLEVGGFTYEVLIPKTVYLRLGDYMQDGEVQLTVYHYFQADQHKMHPVLIGFLSELERDFFEEVIKVSGFGPKAALKALDRPISEIAEAIDRSDLNYLKDLPGIGMQRAKNLVAICQGKMGRFSLIRDKASREEKGDALSLHKEIAQEAEQVLLQLQYKKKEAEEMVDKALKLNPQVKTLEELLNHIYKQRS